MTERSSLPRRFFTREEQRQIVAAITAAERRTSGEIRVHVERSVPRRAPIRGDAYRRAREVFARIGLHRTVAHNGVLFYIAVRSRQLAVVGDEGLHAHVGDDFWLEMRDLVAAAFADGKPAAGLAAAIARVGERLREHFPGGDDDVNEQPDEISF
jgi:uncharacterized membrane protein